MIEIGIVALILLLQLQVFIKNRKGIKEVASLFPEGHLLRLDTDEEEGTLLADPSIPQIAKNSQFSSYFKAILQTTNAYLRQKKGRITLDILTEMTDRQMQAQEKSVGGRMPLPLYIGLFCTFSGVIIGLVKIAMVGVSDAAIQSFIGGVLIGMLGSATGLVLTILSNAAFSQAKEIRDRARFDYDSFVIGHLLPEEEPQKEEVKVNEMKENLEAFHKGFGQYQQYMNESLGETLRLFYDLEKVFKEVRTVEKGLTGMGNFFDQNEGLIQQQAQYIDTYAQHARALTDKLNSHFAHVDTQLEQLIQQNMKALDEKTQEAYQRMETYLGSLELGHSRALADALNLDLSHLHHGMDRMQQQLSNLQRQMDVQHQPEIHVQPQEQVVVEPAPPAPKKQAPTRTPAGKLFMLSTGVFLFATMVGGFLYIYQTVGI